MTFYQETTFGFDFGNAKVERHCSDDRKGWVLLGLKTGKETLQIYVMKTGKVRIHDANGAEWVAAKRKVSHD